MNDSRIPGRSVTYFLFLEVRTSRVVIVKKNNWLTDQCMRRVLGAGQSQQWKREIRKREWERDRRVIKKYESI